MKKVSSPTRPTCSNAVSNINNRLIRFNGFANVVPPLLLLPPLFSLAIASPPHSSSCCCSLCCRITSSVNAFRYLFWLDTTRRWPSALNLATGVNKAITRSRAYSASVTPYSRIGTISSSYTMFATSMRARKVGSNFDCNSGSLG